MKKTLTQSFPEVSLNLISNCTFCSAIEEDHCKTPVLCTKYSGSCHPIRVNKNTCMICGEYKRNPSNK